MSRGLICAAGFFLAAHLINAVASEEEASIDPEKFAELLVVPRQAEMEKCFGLPDVKTAECNGDDGSEECRASEKRPKDGSEFKYVPRETCTRLGGQKMMAKHPKPQK